MSTVIINPAKLRASAIAGVSSIDAADAQVRAVVRENKRHIREEARAERRRVRLTRRGRLVLFGVSVLAVAGIAVAGSTFTANNAVATGEAGVQAASVNEFGYVVPMPGDTLWQIAQRLDSNRDPRDVVAEIQRLNQSQSAGVSAYVPIAVPKKYLGQPGVISAKEAGL